jgi:hypothetical protein
MNDKWFTLMMIGVLVAISIPTIFFNLSDAAEKDAKSRMVVACYQAHEQNCEKLWK